MARIQKTRGFSNVNILELEDAVSYSEPDNLMLVDCLNLAFRFKNNGRKNFASDYIRTVTSLAKSYNAKRVILLTDYKHSSFRKEILPTYKVGRADKRADQTEEEREEFLEFLEELDRALSLLKDSYIVIKFKNVEADDLAAYLVRHLSPHYNKTWLISTDKDWDLLLNDKVSRFSYVTRKEYTLDNFYEEHGCDTPQEFVSLKVLQGDSKDSVEGIKGVGVKRAYNLIREYGDAIGLYEALPLDGKSKVVQNINASADLILRNYELLDLVDFCESAIAHPDPENLTKLNNIINQVLKEDK
jgi:5'-3' exonuclease